MRSNCGNDLSCNVGDSFVKLWIQMPTTSNIFYHIIEIYHSLPLIPGTVLTVAAAAESTYDTTTEMTPVEDPHHIYTELVI